MENANDHLKFSQHLTGASFDERFRATFIGQAHLAGTGPDCMTCGHCRFWHLWKVVDGSKIAAPPRSICEVQQGTRRRAEARDLQLPDPAQGQASYSALRGRLPAVRAAGD